MLNDTFDVCRQSATGWAKIGSTGHSSIMADPAIIDFPVAVCKRMQQTPDAGALPADQTDKRAVVKFGKRPMLRFALFHGHFECQYGIQIPLRPVELLASSGQHLEQCFKRWIGYVVEAAARTAGHLVVNLAEIYAPGNMASQLRLLCHATLPDIVSMALWPLQS